VEREEANPTRIKLRLRNGTTWRLSTDSPQAQKEWFRALQESSFRARYSEDVRLVLPCVGELEVKSIPEDRGICLSLTDPETRWKDQYVFAFFPDPNVVVETMQKLLPLTSTDQEPLESARELTRSNSLRRWGSALVKLASPRPSLTDFLAHVRGSKEKDLSDSENSNSVPNSPVSGSLVLSESDASLEGSTEHRPTPVTAKRVGHRRSFSDAVRSSGSKLAPAPPLTFSPAPVVRVIPPPEIHRNDSGTNIVPITPPRKGHKRHSASIDLGRALINSKETPLDVAVGDWVNPPTSSEFLSIFNIRDEVLVSVPGYLVRTLPRYGKIYVGKRHLAFKSSVLGLRKTCLVPLQDIVTVEQTESLFRYALLIIAKDGELCFQFTSMEALEEVRTLLPTLGSDTMHSNFSNRLQQYSTLLLDLPSSKVQPERPVLSNGMAKNYSWIHQHAIVH
jgi:hypothetical protein